MYPNDRQYIAEVTPSNCFTVDVEDWFHFEFGGFSVPFSSWREMEGRVHVGTERLLEILAEHDARATFFVLGWIAEKYPELIQKIAAAGHEVACHTYCHHLINQSDPDGFRSDLQKAKQLLEDASGTEVVGFRAPYFSIDESSQWAFQILAEEGFRYDSSIFPAKRLIGGCPTGETEAYTIETSAGEIREIPITVVDFLGKRFTMFGGGYFRLLPLWLVSAGIHKLNARGVPVNFYIHPHDLDPGQPRVKMGAFSRFRRYVGVAKTADKLDRLLSRHKFTSIKDSGMGVGWGDAEGRGGI
jgi:polysaccharide deacetylase family protein (PEP-CTERM system associated)